MWLGSIRPRSQCVGGMLPVQWCHKHVLELSQRSMGWSRADPAEVDLAGGPRVDLEVRPETVVLSAAVTHGMESKR